MGLAEKLGPRRRQLVHGTIVNTQLLCPPIRVLSTIAPWDSAGATHVASYVSHPEFHGPRGSGLAGAILSSGGFDFTTGENSEGRKDYFGADPKLLAERSAVAGLIKTDIPFMISSAELDPPAIAAQSELLKEALCKSEHGCARSLVLPHHGHMSESYAINTSDHQLSDQILEFIKSGK